eukprot:scaffold120302_cov19-Tisochrysis_lutea.AAC.1
MKESSLQPFPPEFMMTGGPPCSRSHAFASVLNVILGGTLRIRGRNLTENEYIKLSAYHTLELEVQRPFTLELKVQRPLTVSVSRLTLCGMAPARLDTCAPLSSSVPYHMQ